MSRIAWPEFLIVGTIVVALLVLRLPRVIRALERGMENARPKHHWSESPPSKYPRLLLIWLAVAVIALLLVLERLLPRIQ